MAKIRIRLVTRSAPLTTHGRLFKIVETGGKKVPRLVQLEPVDVVLNVARSRQADLDPGEYAYIFSAMHDIAPFEIVVERWIDGQWATFDVDKFDPKEPYDTFNISNAFVVT